MCCEIYKMANPIHKPAQQSLLQTVLGKAKTGVEVAGAVKGIFDIGKSLYTGVRAAMPVVSTLAAAML